MSEVSIDHLIEVSKQAVEVGADILVEQYAKAHHGEGKLEITTKASAIDLVTQVDGMAQAAIIDVIQKQFPDHRYIAEEAGAENLGDPSSPYEWIIDPLDGTVNFVHGRISFGPMVALQKDGQLLAGAMHLPLLDQWFYGGRGAGAYYNDDIVKLRSTKNLTDAVLNCNLIHRAKEIDGTLYVSVPPCGSIENYGCAAEELGEILMGHTDGVFFDGIPLWDIAVGFLLIEEAGGKMRYEKKPEGGHIAVGCTAAIFDELWEWCTEKM